MGFTTAPPISAQLITLPPNKHNKGGAARYVIQFDTFLGSAFNTAGTVQIFGPISVHGQSAILDTQAVAAGKNVVDLPAFKALEVTCTFDMSTPADVDGEFIIVIQSTGQVFRFAPQVPETTIAGLTGVLNVVIPLVAQTPTKIAFIKCNSVSGNVRLSQIIGTLVDFDMDSSVYFGVAGS